MTHDSSDIRTIVHLPECPHSNSRTATFYGGYCVCPLLRDCEQRTEEAWSAIAGRDQFVEGYVAGLDAAREAVTRTCHHTKYDGCRPCSHDTAAAAIDALRQPPPPTAHYDPAAKDHRP